MTGILLVDKPRDWTSHDVVAKLRGIYREKRIGHSGTLDPMATGVLAVFLGRATRAVELCENDEKEYEALLLLGTVTNTQDTTGDILETRPVSVTEERLRETLRRFLGPQSQIPPMYSAVKVGGRKLYELARKGQEVARKPRDITIYELELMSFDGTRAALRVRCSKGAYIRTLCHDIGGALGCGGALDGLRRTRAGRFSLDDCHSLLEIQAAKERGEHENLLLPVDALFAGCPALTLPENWTRRCKNGGEIPWEGEDGDYRVYGPDGEFLMLGRLEAGVLRTVKSFFEVSQG